MKMESLSINDQRIDSENLGEWAREWTGDPDIPGFLDSWFDESDTFTAYTSGSTGTPGRVELQKIYATASARATNKFLGLQPGHTALLSMPARYIAGKMMIIRAMTGGFRLTPITPASVPELPDRTIDLAAFTPPQFRGLIQSRRSASKMKLNNVLLGGAPYPDDFNPMLEGFQGRIFETFGMTETYSHVALRQRWPEEAPFFQAMPQVWFQTRDDRLIIQAPHIGVEHLVTNDIVRLDGLHRFHWLGRADFVINSGGIKIHPEIVEKKLNGLIPNPFFIAGLSDKMLGEKVVLIIQNQPDHIPEETLRQLLEQNLDRYEKPKSIHRVDTMVYTPTGKINRIRTKEKVQK